MKSEIVLECDSVVFYSRKDEDVFFDWLQSISCVKSAIGRGTVLYVEIKNTKISNIDLRNLLAIFYRYHVDMKQLAVFLNKNNKSWFKDNLSAYWHKKVF